MKAIGLYHFGGPDVLQVVDVPTPVVPTGSVLVRVAAAAVNPTDLTFRRGGRAAQLEQRTRPLIPGFDFAGHIAAVPAGSPLKLRVGDPVVGLASPLGDWNGAYASYVLADERSVVAAPAGASLSDASTLLLNALTARVAIEKLGLRGGASLLVTGAAGAVGGYAVQVAHERGLRVVAVASAQDSDLLTSWGADYVIARGPAAIAGIRELFPDGVDGVVDGADLRQSVAPAVKAGGSIASLKGWSATLPDVAVVPIAATSEAANTGLLEELVRAAARRQIALRVSMRLPYTSAADAHRLLEEGGVRGRIVLEFPAATDRSPDLL